MHRYSREYAGSLAGSSRSVRGPAWLALGHEARMLLVAGLTLAASLTGLGWLARLALWLPAGVVLAGLLRAQAGEVRAALRLQRARR
jgi:hypothetical protein